MPEEHGGLGLGEVDLVLILEEAGRVALPEPLLETTAIAVPLLVEAGTPEQQATWLPRIAAGDAIATVALGGQRLVTDAHVADLVVAAVDGELHAVPADRVQAQPQPSEDGARRVFTVTLDTDASTAMADGEARPGRRREGVGPRRRRFRCPAGGHRPPPGRHLGRLRQGAHPVRPSHRVVPGRQAPAG